MRIIQCKVNQLWSANPIKAMKAFYDCQTRQVCSEKNDFENDFTDNRHWATDLNDVREAFYDYAGQVKKSKSVFTSFKKHMQKSLYADLEKTIERLKKCIIHFTSETQFNQLLDSISRGLCYSNYDTNNNEPPYECGNTFEEFDESLLNDKCKIINGLVNCLKMYMDEDEIFKLLDVNSSDQVKTKSYVECINTFIKKIFGFISFNSCQQAVQNKPIDSYVSSQTDCNLKGDLMVNKCENRPICKSCTDCNSKGDLMVNKCENRPICKSQTNYNSKDYSTTNKCENRPIGQLQTDAYSSGENLTANKRKIQPYENSQTQVDNMDCCEVNIKLKETLAEMQKIKDQLLCEKKSKEEAGRQLILGIRKASLHIKGGNKLSCYP